MNSSHSAEKNKGSNARGGASLAAALAPPGKVLWQQRRANGDDLILRGYRKPHPHIALEVWRGGKARVVRLSVPELADVAAALLRAPRALCGISARKITEPGEPA